MELLGVRIDVSRADARPVDRRPADGRDRPRARLRQPPHHHGRADGAADAARRSRRCSSIVRRLRDEGRTIVFISHRLEEVRALCDRVTIFRDGNKVATDAIGELDDTDIIRLMIGRPLKEFLHKTRADHRRGGARRSRA